MAFARMVTLTTFNHSCILGCANRPISCAALYSYADRMPDSRSSATARLLRACETRTCADDAAGGGGGGSGKGGVSGGGASLFAPRPDH